METACAETTRNRRPAGSTCATRPRLYLRKCPKGSVPYLLRLEAGRASVSSDVWRPVLWPEVMVLPHFQGSHFSSVQSLSCVRPFATPWTIAHQASLSITNSWNLLKLMSIESVMPANHLVLGRPLLLLPSIFSSIRVFSNESVLHTRWPKY